MNGDYVFKIRGDGGLRLIVNGQTLVDNFASPTRPPVGYGPTVSYSGKITLQAGQTYSVEIDYRRVGGFFDTFEQGGLTGIQVSWASLQPPPNKLLISMEKRLQDNPAAATFPDPVNQHPDAIPYNEGIFIGYRGYDKNHIEALYPFGFGLSYTSFEFSDLKIQPTTWNGTGEVTVTFRVTNTGKLAGAEVAQLYVGQQNPTITRPIKELKGFQKVFLQPNQSQTVTLKLNQRSFAYFNTSTEEWDTLPGKYNILVGSSSQTSDLKLQGTVHLPSEITANP